MAGLQDLLLLRQLQDQADPFRSAFQSLAAGVDSGIKQAQEEAKAKKKALAINDAVIDSINKSNATNKDKSDSILELSYKTDPNTGILTASASTESRSAKATRIKTERENETARIQNDLIKEFNTPGSTLTVTDLINADIKPTEAQKIDELRGVVNISKGSIRQVHSSIISSQNQPGTVIQKSSGGIVAPKLGPSGRAEGFTDIGAQTAIDSASAEVQVAKEVRSQQAKAGELAERGVQRASGTTNTAMDEVLRFNQENIDNYGLKPGAGFGILERLQPEQLNRYKAAAQGAGREAAATVGTQIIPAARAVRMVDIFAKSTAEIGNTVEGNAANVSASMGNVWGTALSTNFEVELNDGSKVPIKTQVKDPLTGKPLSEIQYPEILQAMGRATEEFKLKTEEYYLNKAFDQYPDTLQDSTKQKIMETRRIRRIEELRSRK